MTEQTRTKGSHPLPSLPRIGGDGCNGGRDRPPPTGCTTSAPGPSEDDSHPQQEVKPQQRFVKYIGKKNTTFMVAKGKGCTNVEMAKLFQMHRHTVAVHLHRLKGLVRRGWLTDIATLALSRLLTEGEVAVNPWRIEVQRRSEAACLPECHRSFPAVPTVAHLVEHLMQVYPELFGRRKALYALERTREGFTVACVVIPVMQGLPVGALHTQNHENRERRAA